MPSGSAVAQNPRLLLVVGEGAVRDAWVAKVLPRAFEQTPVMSAGDLAGDGGLPHIAAAKAARRWVYSRLDAGMNAALVVVKAGGGVARLIAAARSRGLDISIAYFMPAPSLVAAEGAPDLAAFLSTADGWILLDQGSGDVLATFDQGAFEFFSDEFAVRCPYLMRLLEEGCTSSEGQPVAATLRSIA